MEKLVKILLLLLLIPRIGICQDLNIPQISNSINKVDSLDQRTGLWIERFSSYIYAIRGYNENGRIDGVQINLQICKDNKYELACLLCFNDGLISNAFIFDKGRLVGQVDSVRPIDSKMFPEVSTAAEKCKKNSIGQYGIVQFYVRSYNHEDGRLDSEGWYLDFLEEDNRFDFELDPLPTGIHKFYENGEVIERDYTDSSIERLLRAVGLIKHDYDHD